MRRKPRIDKIVEIRIRTSLRMIEVFKITYSYFSAPSKHLILIGRDD